MKVTVTTGVRFAAEHLPEYPDATAKSITVDVPDGDGFDPEQVWTAGNRVDSLVADLRSDRCREPWQQALRMGLDEAEAPSVSVGDTIDLFTDAGTQLGSWVCASVGWERRNWFVPAKDSS